MQLACPECTAQMPENAAFCPGCGRQMLPAARAEGKVGIFSEAVAGGIAYLTFVPAVLFLILERFKKNRFVRFHSVQCLLCWGVAIVLALALRVASLVLYLVPVAGLLFIWVICIVLGIAAFVLWLVLIVKALQGEMLQLPVIGELAARYSSEPPNPA